jgi:hypothetical protein
VSEVLSPAEASRELGLSEREFRQLAYENEGRLPVVKRLRDGSILGVSTQNLHVWRDHLDARRAAARRRAEQQERSRERAERVAHERGWL